MTKKALCDECIDIDETHENPPSTRQVLRLRKPRKCFRMTSLCCQNKMHSIKACAYEWVQCRDARMSHLSIDGNLRAKREAVPHYCDHSDGVQVDGHSMIAGELSLHALHLLTHCLRILVAFAISRFCWHVSGSSIA